MHRVKIFLNGAASSSKSQDWRGEIERGLFRSELQFITSKSREQFLEEVRKAAKENVDVIVSVGGDGTFNTLLQELASTKTAFLVVPAGTANDLATELGMSRKLKRAIECIRKNEVQEIDLLSINGRYMATNGGIGLASDVATMVNDLRKKLPGFKSMMSVLHGKAYTMTLLGHLATSGIKYYDVKVDSPQFSGTVRTPLLLINNQPTLAGNFVVAPDTVNNDGRFNVTLFTHPTWLQLISVIYRFKKNLPVDHDPNVISFETKEIRLEGLNGTKLSFFGDGEHLIVDDKLEIKILPKAVRVFRPLCKPGTTHIEEEELESESPA